MTIKEDISKTGTGDGKPVAKHNKWKSKNKGKFNQVKEPKFEGRCSELKGFVFDYNRGTDEHIPRL